MAGKNPLTDALARLGRIKPVDQAMGEAASVVGGIGTQGGAGTSGITEQLTSITQELQQLQAINQTQTDTLEANTQALAQNTGARGQGTGESTVSKIGSTLESALGAGLGLSPLISGLVGLFGGGGSSSPPPLIPYIAPLPIHARAGTSASRAGVFPVDQADGGLPRPAPASSSSAPAAQITVQVQAMDSQSFLDHSNDIALAVRQAMLESSVLNDVIRGV